jgi:hypothetical protein
MGLEYELYYLGKRFSGGDGKAEIGQEGLV